jgi:hypothetical protein
VLDRVLFVVAAPRAAHVVARAQRLARFYGGELWLTQAREAAVGRIGPGPAEPGDLAFGSPLLGAAVDLGGGAVRIATGPADVTALYASGPVWSTHAAAAAYLATGEARIRREAVAELAALGFVPGDATTLEGVRTVPAATVVEPGRGGARVVTAQRTAAAGGDPEERLAAALRDWTAGQPRVSLGLSGGLDSRAVAVALAQAGIGFEAVTWGSPEWADVAAARRVAAALGVPHRLVEPPSDLDPRAAGARARWADGAAPITAPGAGPGAEGVHVTGAGGEIARAFYYRLLARADPAPSLETVASLWRPAAILRHAGREAREGVEEEARAMLERAAARGARGWGVLDRVYADERMRKWGRAMLPRAAGAYAPAFLHPDVVPALLALPLEDRLTAAFHRRLIAWRLPAPPPPPGQRAAVPPPLRRLAARARGRADPFAGGGPAPPPVLRATLTAACDAALVRDALGDRFCERLAAAAGRGNPRAAEIAASLAGLAAFADAVGELRGAA